MRRSHPELSPEDLRWTCDPSQFRFETTRDVDPMEETVGQDRALKALRLGLALFNPGYNIFVSGLTGLGKTSTVRNILERIKPSLPLPPDRVYVNRFKQPHRPRLLSLPRGDGIRLKEGMDELIRFLLKNVPLVFEDETFQKRREEIMERYGEEEKKLFSEFSERLKAESFTLAQVQMGPFTRPEIFPVVDGKAFPVEKVDEMVQGGALDEPRAKRIRKRHGELRADLDGILERSRELARKMVGELDDLARQLGRMVVEGNIHDLKSRFPHPGVAEYFDEVEESILDNLDLFRGRSAGPEPAPAKPQRKPDEADEFRDYRVNVISDNSRREGAPIVIETNPTYSNLFGTIERVVDPRGSLSTDFTKILTGSLLTADGGYLVINAFDLFAEPGVWKVLKRTLKNRQLVIQPPDVALLLGQCSLKPDPIDINCKVILIGDWWMYQVLYHEEPEFRKIFKVLADFDTDMDGSEANVQNYARFARKICDEESLLPLDPSGAARLVEYGVWRSGKRGKLTSVFSDIADMIRESHFWATQDGKKAISGDHIRQCHRAGIERHALPETRIHEHIRRHTVLIDTEGRRVGQVNGLAVFDVGNYTFGAPVRITATVSTGRAGIVNIEREAKLSGRTHDKGVLILSGLLRERYARERPMNLFASLCFEQSYAGVEGDSATAAEIYALQSALSGLPVDQSVAVTGSVNQKGDVQPVGGINAKIEGFFKVCAMRGLAGNEGVIIPQANVQDLMLKEEVVDAVREGKFHVWAITDVDEGAEILMGLPAGRTDARGAYPQGTVNRLVADRLRALGDSLKDSGRARKKRKGEDRGKTRRTRRIDKD